MSEITTPHDSFCKEIMGRPEVAADFMANYLPPVVVARLDLNALELVKDSFVDAELRRHLSDLLFRAPFRDGGEAFIYILFEHKSRPDDWVAFQLLRYEMMIWEPIARRREGKLPPIFPIVFYHGQERWTAARDFVGLIAYAPGMPELLKRQPRLEYYLCDLSDYAAHELTGIPLLRAGLLLLKYIRSNDLGARLSAIFGLLTMVSPEAALQFINLALRYLSKASHRPSVEDIRMAIQEVFPQDADKVIAPFALTWMEEGRQEEAVAFALRLLRKRFGEVSEETESQIGSLSLESLEKLGEDLLDFASLEDLTTWLRAQASSESQTTN
ncbi:MAG: Rpn family recombination-promoting nuclease/putative transposase [Blastocatellia bacterium]